MSTPELDHIAIQILAQLRSVTSQTLGSVTGGPYSNYYFPKQWTDELLSAFPRDVDIFFSHGDLLLRNIVVEGSTITAIVDWESAGFYPEYLEYCQMYSPDSMTPNWNYILRSVFPGEPREALIHAFHRLTSEIWWTLL
ncbi:hypothetical protein JB92DRAFT_2810114 [Gautieria morchelliformis]|nr:hypothetical protein JB92DRAFT_2810114 [Gautieria morchelliformis]